MNATATLPTISGDVPAAPSRLPAGLVDGPGLLRAVWPMEASRPTLRTLQNMRKARLISHIRLGGRVFFEPEKVIEDLRRHEVPAIVA
jgi:hypothetical protein